MTRDVILYTRVECGLCDDASRVLRPLQRQLGFTLREIDIDRDDALRARFNDLIPVVMVNSRAIAQAPIDADELRKALRSALAG